MNQFKSYLLLLLVVGCAHGKMGNIAKPLSGGSLSNAESISVTTVSASDALFSGDKSGDPARVAQSRAEIEDKFSKMIVEALRKKGYTADLANKSGKKNKLTLSGKVSQVKNGSSAARMLVGMGAGSAKMFTNFKLTNSKTNEVISGFEIIATSGGRGGVFAAGRFMSAHLTDGSNKVAEYFVGKKK